MPRRQSVKEEPLRLVAGWERERDGNMKLGPHRTRSRGVSHRMTCSVISPPPAAPNRHCKQQDQTAPAHAHPAPAWPRGAHSAAATCPLSDRLPIASTHSRTEPYLDARRGERAPRTGEQVGGGCRGTAAPGQSIVANAPPAARRRGSLNTRTQVQRAHQVHPLSSGAAQPRLLCGDGPAAARARPRRMRPRESSARAWRAPVAVGTSSHGHATGKRMAVQRFISSQEAMSRRCCPPTARRAAWDQDEQGE